MKKLRITIGLLALCSLFVFTSCTKKKSCTELYDEMLDAMTVFISAPTQQTCEDYYSAIGDYVDGCSTLTPAERAALEDDLDNTNCSIY